MTDYPIPVERYVGDQGLVCICTNPECKAERVISVNEINQDDMYDCLKCRHLSAVMKYAEADRCPGCRRLGWYDDALKGCCSRACMLQAEYAETLRKASA